MLNFVIPTNYFAFLRFSFPAGIYLLKFNSKNTRARCKICLKITIKKPEQHRRSSVVIVNFEHISHLVLVFLSPNLSM